MHPGRILPLPTRDHEKQALSSDIRKSRVTVCVRILFVFVLFFGCILTASWHPGSNKTKTTGLETTAICGDRFGCRPFQALHPNGLGCTSTSQDAERLASQFCIPCLYIYIYINIYLYKCFTTRFLNLGHSDVFEGFEGFGLGHLGHAKNRAKQDKIDLGLPKQCKFVQSYAKQDKCCPKWCTIVQNRAIVASS